MSRAPSVGAKHRTEPDELPWSAEAEQSVLGALMLFGDEAFKDVEQVKLTAADFQNEQHRMIWAATVAARLAGGQVDPVTVFDRLQSQGIAEACGGLQYLNDLTQSVVSVRQAAHHAKLVKDKAQQRKAAEIGRRVVEAARLPDLRAMSRQIAALSDDLRQCAEAPATQRFRLLTSDDVHAIPRATWAVRGVLPATGIAAIFGPSAGGKSFLAFDLAAAIADGGEWFGHPTTPRPVVYVWLEGEAGARARVEAWERANGRMLPALLRLVLQPFSICNAVDVDTLATAVRTMGPGAVVFIDTLNRAAPEADENASADMGRIIEGAKALQRITEGLPVLVHHTGKDASKGLRGHSSLFAALDAVIEVTREGDRREWRVAKAKDGRDGDAHPFRLDVIELEELDDGEAISSCVVAPDDGPQQATRPRGPKGGNQRLVLDALGDLLRLSRQAGQGGAPMLRPCVEIEAAVEAIAPKLTCEPLRRKERTRQALTGLITGAVVASGGGWLWLP